MGRSADPPESLGPCRTFGVAGALRFAKRTHALLPFRLAYGEPEAGIALAWNFSSRASHFHFPSW
jgi:hypothetical protein